MEREKLKEIYLKYKLEESDIFNLKFGSKSKPIITRQGIEKIQAQLKIEVQYVVQKITEDNKHVVVLATGVISSVTHKGKQIKQMTQSFGECAPYNNTNSYPVCMAEKRALSRVVIKMSGLANYGIYGEDEAEVFKNNNN